ncbi:MAG: branched-chain amino acid ABC transporter permease [Clostridia bacterium]|nr:branched-chain amino acid ABC transporter permease [Clostridia bacterium]
MVRRYLRAGNLAVTAVLAAAFLAGEAAIASGWLSPYYQVQLFSVGINVILAVSLNLINGFTGQFSLGHAGFMAVGAYTAAVATTRWGLPFAAAILLAALAAALMGLLVGVPTLRLRGDYLAIATLGFGEILRSVLYNVDYVGGATGLLGIPRLTTWPWLFAMTLLTVLLVKNLVNSSRGLALKAVREDEIAAEDSGVDTTRTKVLAFVIGAVFAGIGGALYAHYFFVIQPTTFSFLKSFEILVYVVLGGLGSVTGSVVSAAALTLLSAALQGLAALRMVLYGLVLVLLMIFRTGGLFGTWELSFEAMGQAWGRLLRRPGAGGDLSGPAALARAEAAALPDLPEVTPDGASQDR